MIALCFVLFLFLFLHNSPTSQTYNVPSFISYFEISNLIYLLLSTVLLQYATIKLEQSQSLRTCLSMYLMSFKVRLTFKKPI
jgi:hypothetical protein